MGRWATQPCKADFRLKIQKYILQLYVGYSNNIPVIYYKDMLIPEKNDIFYLYNKKY